MEYVRLGKLVDLKQGLAINSYTNHLVCDYETSLALLRIADMPTKRKVVFMDENTPDRYIAKEDDIIYTRTGQVGLVFTGQKGVVHNNCFRVIPIDEQTLSRKYLFWVLCLPEIYSMANIYAAGAAQPDLPHTSFKKIKIPICSLPIQNKIASILSAYDNLIEANSRRIKILEQMAENLYKEWFVRFRFPGHEKEEKENGLPKGWNIAPLSSEYNTTSGGTPSRTNLNYYSGFIPWIKTGELQGTFILDTEEHITEEAVRKSSAKLIPAYSLLIAMYAGANVGNLGINSIVATCNQACCVITTKGRYPLYYLLFFLQTQKRFLQSISFGAAQQNISQDIVKKLKVLFPPLILCDTFNKLVSPYLQQCELLLKENQFLTRQRDLLLPRLMSGQLTPLTNQ